MLVNGVVERVRVGRGKRAKQLTASRFERLPRGGRVRGPRGSDAFGRLDPMRAIAEVRNVLGREPKVRENLSLWNRSVLPWTSALEEESRDPGLDSREVVDHVHDGPPAGSEGTGLELHRDARNGGRQRGPLGREELDGGR